MYFRSSKRFDRASIVEGFKQIKDRGVRYEDLFPGSYDPKARVKEIIEDETDAEVIFNGVGTVWNGIKLCPDKELALACFKVYNDWIAELPGATPRSASSATPRSRPPASTTASPSCDRVARARPAHRAARGATRAATSPIRTPDDDRFWAAAVELGMPINVHTQFFFPAGDLGSKITAEGVADSKKRPRTSASTSQAGEFPAILFDMISVGCVRALPGPEVRRHRGATPAGFPYYLERFDESVLRNRPDWNLPLLPSEYFRRNVSVVYIVDELGAANRYDIGVETSCGAPTSRTRRQLAGRLRARSRGAGAGRLRPRARSSGSCGGTAPTLQAPLRRTGRHRRRWRPERGHDVRQHAYKLISSESHVIEPPTVFDELPASLKGTGPKLETIDGVGAWVVEGFEPIPLAGDHHHRQRLDRAADGVVQRLAVAWDAVLPAMYDPAERQRAQWADSIDAEILYPTPELWDAIRMLDDAELKLGLIRAYNDWIADFSRQAPERFFGLGQAPDHQCRGCARRAAARVSATWACTARSSTPGRAGPPRAATRRTTLSGPP